MAIDEHVRGTLLALACVANMGKLKCDVSRIRIKFCGVTSPADAYAAADAGADAVGMIVHARSKRLIDLPTATAVVAALPPYVASVGVFADASPERVREIVSVHG